MCCGCAGEKFEKISFFAYFANRMKEGLESFLLELLLLILKEIFFLISAVFGLFVEFSMGIYMRGGE